MNSPAAQPDLYGPGFVRGLQSLNFRPCQGNPPKRNTSEMNEETYTAAINRAADALHADLQSDDRAYRDDETRPLPLADHTVDYQERVFRTATVIVDALVDYFPSTAASVVLPEPLRSTDAAAVFNAGEDLPAVRVEGGIVRFGAQSYWNIGKGDSPAELAGALLAAEQYAKAGL